MAAEIARAQTRERSAEEILREETRRHFQKLGPDGARELSRWVALYFRWLRSTKGTRPEDRFEAAEALETRFASDPGSFEPRELAKAVPEWVSEVCSPPSDWHAALQRPPRLWLRARPGTGGRLAADLGDAVRPFPALPDVLRFDSQRDIFRTEAFLEGSCEVQDPGSHLVGLACAPLPGSVWWDACAGEGGKTMHLADLMCNQGLIWASDKAGWRLERLRKRASRLGRFNVRTVTWAGGSQRPTRTAFDGVLVDAPCSGLGTWHRDPWARWTSLPADVTELAGLQRHLLATAAPSVKVGGRLVYAVCTVSREETLGVADFFTGSQDGFEPVPLGLPHLSGVSDDSSATRLQIWQGAAGFNGMFIAAWRRVR